MIQVCAFGIAVRITGVCSVATLSVKHLREDCEFRMCIQVSVAGVQLQKYPLQFMSVVVKLKRA